MAVCKCGEEFEKTGKQTHCNLKCAHKFKKSRRDPDKNRDWKYKQLYNLSLEEYNKMFEEQQGSCFTCKKHQTQALCVDHNHETGEVRHLLCNKCNMALGLLNDDPVLIAKLLEYVS